MNDLDKAELRSWLIINRDGWNRVRQFFDMRIAEVRDESLEYITQIDRDGLCEAKGKLLAFKEVCDLIDLLS